MKRRQTIAATLARLADAEAAAVRAAVLAPVVRGHGARVRVLGVVCNMTIAPADFHGWGVFAAASYTTARLVRAASMAQRRRYLDLLPAVRMVVCRKGDAGTAHAVPAGEADGRFNVGSSDVMPVHLVEDAEPFDTVLARFDGGQFWFDAADPRGDPATAAYLREAALAMCEPDRLDRPNLSAGHRRAYAVVHDARVRRREADRAARERARMEADPHYRAQVRLRDALAHAGAALRDFADVGEDAYRVTYTVDGRRHTSVVGRRDLTVRSAGICLSGEDEKFDLASLVGVLREGGM